MHRSTLCSVAHTTLITIRRNKLKQAAARHQVHLGHLELHFIHDT